MSLVRAVTLIGIVDVLFVTAIVVFAHGSGLIIDSTAVAYGVAFMTVFLGIVYLLWYHPV